MKHPFSYQATLPRIGVSGKSRKARLKSWEWGQPQGVHALTAEALTEGVSLRLRPGLYQCVLEADGKVAARERLLIVR